MIARQFDNCPPVEAQTCNARRRDETDGARLIVLINADGQRRRSARPRRCANAAASFLVGQASFGQSRVHTVIPMNGGRDGFLRIGARPVRDAGERHMARMGSRLVTEASRHESSDATLDHAVAMLRAAATRAQGPSSR
jgi:hypothetical protein